MIRFFPTPFPDELFYNIITRYITYSGCSPIAARRNLFGSEKSGQSIEFPSRLTYFCDQLMWSETYNPEDIIQRYTLFPLYSPFLSRHRQEQIKELMYGEHGNRIYWLLGSSVMDLGTPTSLKYCPLCVQGDKKKFGESYWHRSHQGRWTYVCAKHKVHLEQAANIDLVRWGDTRVYMADKSIELCQPRIIGNDNQSRWLHAVSHDFAWLLSQPFDSINAEDLLRGYRPLARERGFADNNGKVRPRTNFIDQFINFYSKDFLKYIDKTFVASPRGWPTDLFTQKRKFWLPIQHVLLIRFLGMSLAEFYQYSRGQRKDDEVKESAANPELTLDNITQYWMNPELSINNMAKIFNRNHNAIKRCAIKAGLPFPREFHKNPRYQGRRYSSLDFLKTRESKRMQWKHLLENNPGYTRAQIKKEARSLFGWLSRYDDYWLQTQQPKAVRVFTHRKQRVDWPLLDKKLSEAIPGIIKSIIEQPGRPIRTTLTEIFARAGEPKAINYHTRLPMTQKAIEENIESLRNYTFRKIAWVDVGYKERKRMSRAVFIASLHIKWARNDPEIMRAALAVFERLEKYWKDNTAK